MPRGIDHIVIAVQHLAQTREVWRKLGFTLTPTGRHPFGTENALVQLDGNYLELLGVSDPASIPEPDAAHFSFAAFNRDFLKSREGISMLALKSDDAAADRADFESRGLPVYAPLHFERLSKGPDGVDRKVAFSLTFTREPRLRQAGFFTCQHHMPENFWYADYQRHANGALRVVSIALVTRDPADFHEFMTYVTRQHDMVSTSLGVIIDTGAGMIEIMSPIGYRAWFGASPEPDPRRFLGCKIAVADLAETRRVLEENGVLFSKKAGALVVPSEAANGVAIAFVESARSG